MVIEGESVRLRPVRQDDLPDRVRWLNKAELVALFETAGRLPITVEQMVEWYRKSCLSGDQIHLAIETKAGLHIGAVQFKGINWIHRHAEFGIFIGDEANRGKGWGGEACRLMLHYGFAWLGLHRIWLKVLAGNEPAFRMYKKAGFSEEARWHDDVFRDGCYLDSIMMYVLAPQSESALALNCK